MVEPSHLRMVSSNVESYSSAPPAHGGNDGGNGMERIARLEARADSMDQRLGRIEEKIDRIVDRLASLPTTNGLWGMVATVIGVGLAIAGLTFAVASYATSVAAV